MTLEQIDLNLDGITDKLISYLYDANGKISTQLVDKNNDGSIDESTSYNYDVNGFSALTDAVVEITGYKGNLANLAVV